MKYIKQFEDDKNLPNRPNFDVGDIVICIDDSENVDVIKGKIYKVIKIYPTNGKNDWMCKITNINNKKVLGGFYCSRFSTELEIATNKYNL